MWQKMAWSAQSTRRSPESNTKKTGAAASGTLQSAEQAVLVQHIERQALFPKPSVAVPSRSTDADLHRFCMATFAEIRRRGKGQV